MATIQKRPKFFETAEGQAIEEKLRLMQLDEQYVTEDSYTPNSDLYPDNVMPFAEKHKNYLIAHADIDANAYLSNLRLKTRFSYTPSQSI